MSNRDVTLLLGELNNGSETASAELIEAVYGELKSMAASRMRSERSGHTLQPTALVNEAFLRLAGSEGRLEDRAHFFGAAARAMERVLVDYARKKSAQKRGGDAVQVTLHDLGVAAHDATLDVLGVHNALAILEQADEELSMLVRYRYFAGLTLEDIAAVTDRSLSTVKRQWTYARAWLYERLVGSE
jgi:RNA polymerase sigma factor (TIGR02999 family)